METIESTRTDWKQLTLLLGDRFAGRADQQDRKGTFVFDNYADLKQQRYFSAAIPEELGGGGLSHSGMCDVIRTMAHYCGSTALAFSMHQHLIAAASWRFKHKGEARAMLEKVARNELVLVSTGARDWLDSNGEMTRTEGGYLLSAKKQFASQSPAGDIAVTSAPYHHPDEGWQVLHFAVPMKADGVSIQEDWDVMGMRASGSHTIIFANVFVPDSSIVLARPRTGYHPVWDVVLLVAMPLIMSVYVGLAEKAMEIAISIGKGYARNQKHLPYIVGKLNNSVTSARAQWKAMVALAGDLEVKPDKSLSVEMLSLKTNVSDSCIEAAQLAMEVVGGQGFYRRNLLERIFRDIQASQFHPLPRWEQMAFTGEQLLGTSLPNHGL
jgi:alkylation response protein AidB-like acyl-CoA dehydrogenase